MYGILQQGRVSLKTNYMLLFFTYITVTSSYFVACRISLKKRRTQSGRGPGTITFLVEQENSSSHLQPVKILNCFSAPFQKSSTNTLSCSKQFPEKSTVEQRTRYTTVITLNVLMEESTGKRGWNSNFHGGLGKRRWNSNFSGGLGKRAWNSNFSGGLGKRAWNKNFSGIYKRNHNDTFKRR